MYPEEGAESFLATENRRLKRDLDLWRSRTSKLTEELADDTSLRGTGLVTSDNALLSKARALERENVTLKTKLASQNPAILEELEDLKYNYKESIKTNVKYEAAIKELCVTSGRDPEALIRKITCT
jgi:DNA-binding Lrp family transcriptional regulator